MILRKIRTFMRERYGANGIDKLSITLVVLYFLLYFITKFIENNTIIKILYALQYIFLAYFFFRFFSKNIYARQKENRLYCNFWRKIKSFFKLQIDRIKDIKKFRYRICPKCKAKLRLPVKKGKHTVKCPVCGNKFFTKNLF